MQKQFCSTDNLEDRLWQPLWLDGHEISIYWETIARWIPRRVRRDAERLNVPVLHVQARDDCSNMPLNAMDEDTRKRLVERFLTKANMGMTGNLPGVLSLHVGMRVRLKRNLSLKRGLAQEAEGAVVDVVFGDSTPVEVTDAWTAQESFAELSCAEVPLGVWVLMDEYSNNPNIAKARKLLLDSGAGHVDESTGERILSVEEEDCASRLLFVERLTSFPFTIEIASFGYKLTRTQLPLTHARVRTCQSSQGLTYKGGVVIDLTKMKATEDDIWWLNLYVMLSRGIKLENLLLFNAPAAKEDWDKLKPPSDLLAALARLEKFAEETAAP